jgi:hypothetical protein
MADFNVRADGVDVEQIMRQIRGRIRDKRGVDYTEDQIQELAKVKLEKFLDPKGVRSDLLDQFRRAQVPQSPQTFEFDDTTLYQSDKGVVRLLRKLFRPLLKMLFNPNTLNQVLHTQTGINRYMVEFTEHRAARDVLYYEIIHNLVVEVTRATIEVKNMKMRVESIASRLEFNERRARALEAVVQYKPENEPANSGPGGSGAERGGRQQDRERGREPGREPARRGPEGGHRVVHSRSHPATAGSGDAQPNPPDPITGGDSLRSRRKRRRRGRRSGPGFEEGVPNPGQGAPAGNNGERPLVESVHAGNDGEETTVNLVEEPSAGNDREVTSLDVSEGTSAGNPSEGTPVKDPSES